ncbi:MAG TPA: sulfite exporter TauE/SafE family protein [Vicinamibacterales bacterium]|nr:sulfite exporter TauE/SafE family protein [Vicinamibacterales bacterium]
MTATGITLALIIGLGMGLLGGGGSLVAVPAFSFLMHFPPKDAVVTSLAIVGVAAAAGAAAGLMRRVLPVSTALIVGVSAMAGAAAGSRIGALLADRTQFMALGMLMLVAAGALVWAPQPRDPSSSPASQPLLSVIGLLAGVLTGLVGVGGGFLIVPALVVGGRLPMRQAAAASLLVIALAAVAAIPGYLSTVALDWSYIAPLAGVAGIGAIVGSGLAQYLPQRRLQQVFAALLVILGPYLLLKA